MRIVHLIYAGLGGHTSVFFSHEKYAEQYGIDFSVCLYGIEEPIQSTIDQLDDKKIPYSFIKKKKGLDLKFTYKIAQSILSFKPDIVFLHSAQPLPLIKLCSLLASGTKPRFIVRETQALNLKTLRQRLNSALALFLADKIVFLSEDYRNQFFAGKFWKKPFRKKTTVILNGLDTDYFAPQSDRVVETPQGIFKLGMISRLVPIKDHRTLIDATALLLQAGFNLQLHIAGEGTTFEEIKNYISQKNLQNVITMHGLITGAAIIRFFHNLDIYVHSSLGETMSNSIMQAQSCGLPIVATDVFGINNVIENKKNGFLFPLGNKKELTAIITQLLTRPELIDQYGRISREYAITHLSDKHMFRQYHDIFINLIQNDK